MVKVSVSQPIGRDKFSTGRGKFLEIIEMH